MVFRPAQTYHRHPFRLIDGEVGERVLAASRLTADVEAAAVESLKSIGFKKRSGSVFTKALEDGLIGWLGLNRAVSSRGETVEINPVVGVRHQAIERLIAALHGERPHSYQPPTISISMGYLMPAHSYRAWIFTSGQEIRPSIENLLEAFQEYGLPFIDNNATLASIADSIRAGHVPVAERRAERLSVALLLRGYPTQALSETDAFVATLGDRADPAAARYRSFATALGEHIAGSSARPRRT